MKKYKSGDKVYWVNDNGIRQYGVIESGEGHIYTMTDGTIVPTYKLKRTST